MGLLQKIGEAKGEARVAIPKIIHQYWTGGPIPEWLRGFPQQWQEMNPDWTVRLWTDETLPPMSPANQFIWKFPDNYAPRRNIEQLRADIVRYELLHRLGGVWVDMDFEPLRPFQEWPVDWDGQVPFATWERDGEWVANGMMGSPPGDPFIGRLTGALASSIREHRGKRPAISSGPQFVTRVYFDGAPERVQVLQQRLFYPYSFRDLGTPRMYGPWPPETLAVHHWNNQRKRLRVQLRSRR